MSRPRSEADDAGEADDGDTSSLASGAVVVCPYCGEGVEIVLDAGGGAAQEYVEDCEVCCRPWLVTVTYARSGRARVTVVSLDD